MRIYLIAILLFLLPSCVAFPMVRVIGGKHAYIFGRRSKIGFSLVLASRIRLDDNAKIRHGNFIMLKRLEMRMGAQIKYFNRIKGRFGIFLGQRAVINQFNIITSGLSNFRESTLSLGDNSIIGVSHLLDMTANICIGDNSILAGSDSQLWTHGFYHSKSGRERWRIDGRINIGDNVYLGTRSVVCAGVCICNATTVGAGSVVSKSLEEPGLYVNQALRHIYFDPDEAIKELYPVMDHVYEKGNNMNGSQEC